MFEDFQPYFLRSAKFCVTFIVSFEPTTVLRGQILMNLEGLGYLQPLTLL